MKALSRGTQREDLHALSGSYALDALPDLERELFERHLQHCASCEVEVRGLREAAARLALARAVEPPDQLRQRVLAASYRTRQLPPPLDERLNRRASMVRLVLPSGHQTAPSGHQTAPAGHRAAPAGRGTAPSGHRTAPSGHRTAPAGRGTAPSGHRTASARHPHLPRAIAAAVAVGAAAAIAFGVVSQVTAPSRPPAAISSVLGARDAQTETMRTADGGTVTVTVSWDQREAVVTTAGLSSLPSARVYQLWVMSPAGTSPVQARSAGLLHSSPVLASALRPGDRIGITVEPAGGTAQPTTPPVVTMTLPV